MSDVTNATVIAEKPKKTKEEIAAENEARNKARVDRTLQTLKSAAAVKEPVRSMLLSAISGQTNFMLTESEWKVVRESKEFKVDFLDEILSGKYNFTRKTATRAGGTKEPIDLVGGFRNVTNASVDETGKIINQKLADAGKRVRTALTEFEEANKADLKLMLDNKLDLMFYIRVIKEEAKDNKESKPETK